MHSCRPSLCARILICYVSNSYFDIQPFQVDFVLGLNHEHNHVSAQDPFWLLHLKLWPCNAIFVAPRGGYVIIQRPVLYTFKIHGFCDVFSTVVNRSWWFFMYVIESNIIRVWKATCLGGKQKTVQLQRDITKHTSGMFYTTATSSIQ